MMYYISILQDLVSKKFLDNHWNGKRVVSEENFNAIGEIIMVSYMPRMRIVCQFGVPEIYHFIELNS